MANQLFNVGMQLLIDSEQGNHLIWGADANESLAALLSQKTDGYTFDATDTALNDSPGPIDGESTHASYLDKGQDGRIVAGDGPRTVATTSGVVSFRIANDTFVWNTLNASVGTELAIILAISQNGANATFFQTDNDANNAPAIYIDDGTNIPINTNGGDVTVNFAATEVLTFTSP